MKIKDVMTASVHTISSGRSIRFASSRMEELRIGSLLVEDHGKLVGIVTSRDVRSAHPNRIVADAMTANPLTVQNNCFVWDALDVMEKHNIERLIVTADREQVEGIVTREAIRCTIAGYRDSLTGLYKAPYVEYIAEDLLQRKRPFQLLFFDLNDFGKINKQWGHTVGDALLVAFSRHIESNRQHTDYIARYAGDEFVVLTLRSKDETRVLVSELSRPIQVNEVTLSPSVGVLYASDVADFFAQPYRELLRRASLLSTRNKKSANAG